MLLVPRPGGGNDVFELGKFRFPTEFADGFFGGGDQVRRVAGAARFFDRRNFFAGDFLAHLDDLPHGIAVAVAEVVKTGFAGLQRQHVRLREVDDVDVIADAGAVGRRDNPCRKFRNSAFLPSATNRTFGIRCVSMR